MKILTAKDALEKAMKSAVEKNKVEFSEIMESIEQAIASSEYSIERSWISEELVVVLDALGYKVDTSGSRAVISFQNAIVTKSQLVEVLNDVTNAQCTEAKQLDTFPIL